MPALAGLLVGFVLFSSSNARAEDSYGQKDGFVRLGLGAASAVGGAFALADGSAFARGLAYPLFAGGVVHAARGGMELGGTADVDRRPAQLRLAQVLDASLFAAGGMLAYFGQDATWRGFGLGLAIEGGALLLCDVFAERRATHYA